MRRRLTCTFFCFDFYCTACSWSTPASKVVCICVSVYACTETALHFRQYFRVHKLISIINRPSLLFILHRTSRGSFHRAQMVTVKIRGWGSGCSVYILWSYQNIRRWLHHFQKDRQSRGCLHAEKRLGCSRCFAVKMANEFQCPKMLPHRTLLHKNCGVTALQCRMKVKFILTWNAFKLRWLAAESNQYIVTAMQLWCIWMDLKANRFLGFIFIKRNLYSCSKNVKNLAYKILVRPTMEYCGCIWDPSTNELTQKLESVQNSGGHFIIGNYKHGSSVAEMKKEL